jgi:hypothetical protein
MPQLLRLVPVLLTAAACAGSSPPPAAPEPRATPLQLTFNTDHVRMRGDGQVTLDDKPFLTWTGNAFTDVTGTIVVKVDPAGILWGTGMKKHPHFASDDRLVADDGTQALVVAGDGTVTLYNGTQAVPGIIKFDRVPADARRTAALLVIATMIRMAITHAQEAAAKPAS